MSSTRLHEEATDSELPIQGTWPSSDPSFLKVQQSELSSDRLSVQVRGEVHRTSDFAPLWAVSVENPGAEQT